MRAAPLAATLAAVLFASGCVAPPEAGPEAPGPDGAAPPAPGAPAPADAGGAGGSASRPASPGSGTGGGGHQGEGGDAGPRPPDGGDEDGPDADEDVDEDDQDEDDERPDTTVERRSITVTFAETGAPSCAPGSLAPCRTSVASDVLEITLGARTVRVDAWAWWNGTAGETAPLRLVLYDAEGVERVGRSGWSGVRIDAAPPFRSGPWYVAVEASGEAPASLAGRVHVLAAVEET